MRTNFLFILCLAATSCMMVGTQDFDPDYELAADGSDWTISAARSTWIGENRDSVKVEFRGDAAERLYELLTVPVNTEVPQATVRNGQQISCRLATEMSEGGDPLYSCAFTISRDGKVSLSKLGDNEIPMALDEAMVSIAPRTTNTQAHIRIGTLAGKEIYSWLVPEDFTELRFVKGDLYCIGFRPTMVDQGETSKIYRCGTAFDATGATIEPPKD